jgi:hypothetical protein
MFEKISNAMFKWLKEKTLGRGRCPVVECLLHARPWAQSLAQKEKRTLIPQMEESFITAFLPSSSDFLISSPPPCT